MSKIVKVSLEDFFAALDAEEKRLEGTGYVPYYYATKKKGYTAFKTNLGEEPSTTYVVAEEYGEVVYRDSLRFDESDFTLRKYLDA